MSEVVLSVKDECSVERETLAELEKRHKAEVRKLEGEVRALLKTAKKSTKVQIETQIIRMQYDLKERHQEEYEALESAGGESEPAIKGQIKDTEASENESALRTDEDIAAAKKAKAKKKQVWFLNENVGTLCRSITSCLLVYFIVATGQKEVKITN